MSGGYEQQQAPAADFSGYQPASATQEVVPINLSQGMGQQQQDYSQYAAPQQQAPAQQYQNEPTYQEPPQYAPDQQYRNEQQPQFDTGAQPSYENTSQPSAAPQNPFQSQSQYDAGQGGAWGDPALAAQSQYAAPPEPQEEPISQFQQDLMAQQEAARQATAAHEQQFTGQHARPTAPYGQAPNQSAYGGQQTQQDMSQPAPQQSQPMHEQQAPQAMQQAPYQAPPPPPPPPAPPAPPQQQQGTQEQQWQSPQSHVPTKKFRLRRAIDLVMPPVDADSLESLKSFKIADYDMEWLITDLEGGMRTGCIKATSEQKLSRAAALLYRGRAVGCIYGCKANPDGKPTEESLSAMLSDLEAPDAVVTLYDLPEDVTVAMSALFLGYPIDPNPNMTTPQYCEFLMKWFTDIGATACLAVTVPKTKSTYLVFVHKGKFAGAFFVEEQQFTRDPNAITTMFTNFPDAKIEASMINSETLNSGMRFGYSLSMARQKRSGF